MLSSSKRLQTVAITNQYDPKIRAEAIANKNDLLSEILFRLPVISLLRFKSVSKSWYSLISDTNFSRRLLPDSVAGLFLSGTFWLKLEYAFVPLTLKSFGAPFKSLTFDDNAAGLRILQSCNGLLCCSCFHAYSSKHDYYIYNPSTQQFFKLPQLAIEETITVHGVGLAFDPSKAHYYEVVFIREPDVQVDLSDSDPEESSDFTSYQIEIFSSKTRSWRLSGNPFVAPFGTEFKGGVFCNGAMHWLSFLYFNLVEEKLGKMPTMPSILEGREESRLKYFGESRNHLHLIEIQGPRSTQLNIYEMESDYSSWFVKYHVNLDPIPVAFPEMIRNQLDPSDFHHYMFSIVSVVREANDEESYMVLHIHDKAIRYKLKDGNFKKICDFDSDNENLDDFPIKTLRYEWDDACQFIPTLYSV